MLASTVQGFGESRQSFITDYAPGSPDEQMFGGDTVINVFTRNVMLSVNAKKRPKFGVSADMRRWAGMDGTLRYCKTSLLMQALVFCANGRPNQDEDGKPLIDEDGDARPLLAVVCLDGKQTLNAVMRALVEPSDPGKPLDAITNNKYGGMAELEGNKLFLNSVMDAEGKQHMLRPSVQTSGKGWVATPFPLGEDAVKELWHPWEDLLFYMTADEQCKLLAYEFGADAVNYLVGTDPLYRSYKMPDEIAKRGYGQYSCFVDGVKDVAQTIQMPDSAKPAVKGLGMGLPKKPLGMKPQPKPAVDDEFSGIPKSAAVDTDKLRQEVERIRAAANAPARKAEEQAAAAADLLLNDSDVQMELPDEYDAEDIGL